MRGLLKFGVFNRRMTTMLVFGTSTTYGAWDTEGGWVQRLRRYLDEKQLSNPQLYYMVYNLGISGDTSDGIFKRIAFETEQRLALKDKGEDVIILISAGVNDAIYNNKTGKHHVPLETYGENVKKIIRIAKTYTKHVIFVSSKPIDEPRVDPIPWLKDCSYKEADIEQYDKKTAEVCARQTVPFMDIYHPLKKLPHYQKLFPDGVHLNNEGHQKIFEIVKDELVRLKLIP